MYVRSILMYNNSLCDEKKYRRGGRKFSEIGVKMGEKKNGGERGREGKDLEERRYKKLKRR